MISITPLAQEKLSTYLAENKVEPQVRVYLPDCGCSGPSQLALALDRPEAGVVYSEKPLQMSDSGCGGCTCCG